MRRLKEKPGFLFDIRVGCRPIVEQEDRTLHPVDEDQFKAITAQVLAQAEAGDLDACERLLIGQLEQVRGENAEQELAALSNLAAIYGRVGRVLESLVLSHRSVDLAREADNAYREARALTGVCTGRYGLRIGADLATEVERLRELLADFPVRDDTLVLHMEAAFVEFTHALGRGELAAARAHMERFGELAARLDREQALTVCVQLAGRAELALHAGDPSRTLELLDEIRERGVAAPFHLPELSVLRVEARIALGDLETARNEAGDALEAIANAPPIARSDCVEFGSRLADALAGPLDDVEAARRAHDIVAAAVFERIKQVDRCSEALPELGMPIGAHQADLVRYRKSFVSQQRTLLARVAAMFRAQEASALRRFLVSAKDEDEALFAICAWCESVRGKDGRWIGIGHLVPREGPFQITHGICPQCAAAM